LIDQQDTQLASTNAQKTFDRELAFSLLSSGVCQFLGRQRDSWTDDPMALEDLSARIMKMLGTLLR
jgi:hypothetical protein